MGIDLELWRARIGCNNGSTSKDCPRRVPTIVLRGGYRCMKGIIMCASIIIALCGDVELNPGPVFGQNGEIIDETNPREHYRYSGQVHERLGRFAYVPRDERQSTNNWTQEAMDTNIGRNNSEQHSFPPPQVPFPGMQGAGAGLNAMTSDGSTDMTSILLKITSQLGALRLEVSEWKAEMNGRFDLMRCELESEIDSLNARIASLEDKTRENNLIFFGLPDEENEKVTACEEKVRKVLLT